MRHITKQALVLSGHTGSVFSVAFSPNARLIASGSGDGTVRVWDINTGTAKVRPLRAHADSVWSVAFSPEGDRIASGSRDCTIIIWNAHDGSILAPFTRQTGPVMSVSFSPRGNLIASGSTNHAVCIWDARSGAALAGPLWKHSDCVSVVAFSPDGTRVASGSHDRNIYVWDAYTGSVMAGPFQHNMSRVLSIAFSRDGSRIVSGSRNGTICVVDASSGVVQTTLRLSRSRCVFSVDFSPDGTHIVSGSANNNICLSDSHTGSILAKLSQDRPDPIHSVTFSPDGNQIAAGCGNGNITILPVRIARSISRQDVPTHNYFENPLVPIPAARARYTDVFISRQLSSTEMFQLLVQHGCIDLSSNIDPDGFSSVMVAGGSFGDIWRGRLLDGTAVAIKVWRITSMPQDDPKQLKRTVREIYNWSKVKHENVQELMGVLMFQGRLGMVSLWMDYGNLREYILNHPYVDRYPLCSQVAAGLSYLHTNDMVHGDLKAVNVLVSRNGVAKLNDFDHSIMFECSLLFSETSRPGGGTTRWMAPELLLGSDDDVSLPRRSKQADVYALGMTMLEIITGTVPYPECNNEPRVITKLIGKILPVRSAMHFRNSRRDNHMWELLVSCWNYEPAARPTAAEVLESVKFIAVL